MRGARRMCARARACAYVMTRGVTRLTRIQDNDGKAGERGSIGSDRTLRHHTNEDRMRMKRSKGQRPRAQQRGAGRGNWLFLQGSPPTLAQVTNLGDGLATQKENRNPCARVRRATLAYLSPMWGQTTPAQGWTRGRGRGRGA